MLLGFVARDRRSIQTKALDRLQRRTYRRHTKFRGRRLHQSKTATPRPRTQRSEPNFGGWASLRAALPHWLLLLPCFIIPPRVNTREDAFDILWEEMQQEQRITAFLSLNMIRVRLHLLPISLPFLKPPHLDVSRKIYGSSSIRLILLSVSRAWQIFQV